MSRDEIARVQSMKDALFLLFLAGMGLLGLVFLVLGLMGWTP